MYMYVYTCVYMYIYIYIMCIYVCIYDILLTIVRERERDLLYVSYNSGTLMLKPKSALPPSTPNNGCLLGGPKEGG